MQSTKAGQVGRQWERGAQSSPPSKLEVLIVLLETTSHNKFCSVGSVNASSLSPGVLTGAGSNPTCGNASAELHFSCRESSNVWPL